MFNVIATTSKGIKIKLNASPMDHHEACTFKSKFIVRKCRHIALEEITLC